MKLSDISVLRLLRHQISQSTFQDFGALAHFMGALQAQDFTGGKWSLGLRVQDGTEVQVEEAIAKRQIVRTWPMRGTLHFVAARDVRWMLRLLTPRVVAGAGKRRLELGLDDATLAKAEKIVGKALAGGVSLSREKLIARLEKDGVAMDPRRAYHIFWKLAQEGLICGAVHEGKQPSFALLEDWVPASKLDKLSGDDALSELAARYFNSHGPATLADFVWWSGLRVSEARKGLEAVEQSLRKETIDGTSYWMAKKLPKTAVDLDRVDLLPGFDEYLLGYTGRSAVLDPKYASNICPGGNGIFLATILIGGRVAGTWKKAVKKGRIDVVPTWFGKVSTKQKERFAEAMERYRRYLGK